VYGSRGSFLASLAALSLLSITSHHHQHHSQNSITINRSQVIARQTPASPQQYVLGVRHGTRVSVCDLFGNMPVRVKQRAALSMERPGSGKEWEELHRKVTGLLLAWPFPLFLNIQEAVSRQRFQFRSNPNSDFFHVIRGESEFSSHVCGILCQANYIQPQQKSSWVSATASTAKLSIRGVISLEPAPTKSIQFLSLGISPLDRHDGYNLLYEEVNKIFSHSSFGTKDTNDALDDEEKQSRSKDHRFKRQDFTNQEIKGQTKGVDRWPMFYINVDILESAAPRNPSEVLMEDQQGMLSHISELLSLMLVEFLRSHHFCHKSTRSRILRTQSQGIVDNASDIEDVDTASQSRQHAESDFEKSRNLSHDSTPAMRDHGKQKAQHRAGSPGRRESPFNSWSRIKSGRQYPSSGTQWNSIGFRTQLQNAESLRAVTELKPSSSLSRSEAGDHIVEWATEARRRREITNQSIKIPSVPSIVTKSGQVIRQPFANISARSSTVQPKTKTPLMESDTTTTEAELEVISWLNPISKENFLVDTQTGLASRISSTYQIQEPFAPSIPSQSTIALRKRSYQEPSDWIKRVLGEWNNPVFEPTEKSIPQVSIDGLNVEAQQILRGHHCSELDIDRAFKESSAGVMGQLSKESLRHADIISQVDKKFILIKLSRHTHLHEPYRSGTSGDTLVIVDQHAADERCRLENLLSTLWTSSGVVSSTLTNPMAFDISWREVRLLDIHKEYFASWGIVYNLPKRGIIKDWSLEQNFTVIALPSAIVERCMLEPKLVVDLIRSEAWKCDEREKTATCFVASKLELDQQEPEQYPWLKRIHDCPQGILDMLNSRACRSKWESTYRHDFLSD
jgi:DNA mismatch repair protein MLH3